MTRFLGTNFMLTCHHVYSGLPFILWARKHEDPREEKQQQDQVQRKQGQSQEPQGEPKQQQQQSTRAQNQEEAYEAVQQAQNHEAAPSAATTTAAAVSGDAEQMVRELRESSARLKAVGQDPLPDALRLAEAAKAQWSDDDGELEETQEPAQPHGPNNRHGRTSMPATVHLRTPSAPHLSPLNLHAASPATAAGAAARGGTGQGVSRRGGTVTATGKLRRPKRPFSAEETDTLKIGVMR
ncbi:unnamed protein product [Closterium sp. Naga37s-1]|nr:unnamed protein product [Closterium sp. Naga37s-1]